VGRAPGSGGFLPARLHCHLNPRKTVLQPVERGIDFVGHVIKPWRRTTRPRTVARAIERLRTADSADVFTAGNSYLGLVGQASHPHRERARIAKVLLKRGHVAQGDFSKIYRIDQEAAAARRRARHQPRRHERTIARRSAAGCRSRSQAPEAPWRKPPAAPHAHPRDGVALMGKKHYDRSARDEQGPQVFRIAFRHEGEFWNAYLARNETMKDAMLVGSIRMGIVAESDAARQAFLMLMNTGVVHFARIKFGVDLLIPTETQPAPEHEKAGHA
jgi:hypothetical protein